MEKKPTNETTNNSENENVDLKLKKDENNEMIVNDAENAGIDDDWDEDRIPIIRNSIDISKFLRERNVIIDDDWVEDGKIIASEISTNEKNENFTIEESGEFVEDDDWDENRIPIIRNSINISEFLENNRNAIIDNDCNEISSNEENEYAKINDNGIPNIRNIEQFIEEQSSCYN